MTTSELTPKALHDALVRRVKHAMAAAPPEDLTTEELQAIADVLEPAVNREPADVVGNVVPLRPRR
jgi:hypothetical protein